jgi:hypothetical protein
MRTFQEARTIDHRTACIQDSYEAVQVSIRYCTTRDATRHLCSVVTRLTVVTLTMFAVCWYRLDD